MTDWSQFTPAQKSTPRWADLSPVEDSKWSGLSPVTYTPEEAAAKIEEIKAQDKPLEQPWIDPIDAVAGPTGFVRKAGLRTIPAIAGSVLSEPIVGGVQDYVDEAAGGLPGYVKAPLQLGTGLATGALLTSGARQAKRGAGVVADAARGIPEQSAKSQFVRGLFEERFKPQNSAIQPPPIEDAAMRASVVTPSQDQGVMLHANPVKEVWKFSTGAWEKHIGSPIWDKLIMQKVPALLEKVPGGQTVNRALKYGYRGPGFSDEAGFNKSLEQMRTNQGLGAEYGVDLGNRLMKLPEQDQLKIGQYLTGGPDAEISPRLAGIADEAKDTLYHLGRQAVDVGLLNEETFFKNVGRYMPRLYTSKEYQGLLKNFGLTPPDRLDLSRFRKRKDIPKEIREEMGEILTPGYPVAKGVAQLTHDIEQAKWFKGIANNPNWSREASDNVAIPEGWEKVTSEKLGALKGRFVHPEIKRELDYMTRDTNEAWRKAYGMWKFGKVIISPKTHMRNVLSNSVLAHLGGMPIYEQPVWLTKAARELAKSGEAWELAKQTGLLQTTFVNKELRGMFDEVAGQIAGIKANSLADNVGMVGKALSKVREGGAKAANLYEAEEQWFKLAKFMHNLDKGMNAERAAEDAEKWLFNYGKLTQFQDRYRSSLWGAPFATFTFKALPRITEAAVKTPWRFLAPAAAIYGIEQAAQNAIGDSDEVVEAKKELRPDWMQGGIGDYLPNFARVPIVDDYGREYWLNLTYIMPWGDLGEQGGAFGIPGSLMPGSNPLAKEAMTQLFNYDPFFNQQIVKDEDIAGKSGIDKALTIAKSRGRHAYNTFAPTLALDIEKGISTAKGTPGPFGGYYDFRGREKAPLSVALDVGLGVKTYPVDYNDQMKRERDTLYGRDSLMVRKIENDIRRYRRALESAREAGKDTAVYDKLIDAKMAQIHGIIKEAKQRKEIYNQVKGD